MSSRSPEARNRAQKASAGVWAALVLVAAMLPFGCTGGDGDWSSAAPYVDLVADYRTSQQSGDSPVPTALAERSSLFLPAGSTAEYLVFARPDSAWSATNVVVRGGSALGISIESDERGIESLAEIGRGQQEIIVPLEFERSTPIRLVLTAASAGEDAGVLLEKPVLLAPPSPVETIVPSPFDPSVPAPKIIVYMIDTLRSDRLGCYGYERPTSPNIDAFAAQSTLFRNTVGQSSWTKPSVASLFTGAWPPAHGAISWKHKLPEEWQTLAETLRDAGYRTAAFSTNPNVSKNFGMDQGFEYFHRDGKVRSDLLNNLVFEWLHKYARRKPFFLYVHARDPHAPYGPPEPFRTQFAPNDSEIPAWKPRWRWPLEVLPFMNDRYDGEIALNDRSFGELVAELKRQGIYDDSFVVLVSDHGEEFKDHGQWRHGNNLYAETLNVPLIIKYPGQIEGRVVESVTQHTDLMPTLLHYVNLPIPDSVEGRVLPALPGSNSPTTGLLPRRVFSHLRLGGNPPFYSVVDGDWKFIRREAEQGTSFDLFNWRDDPQEQQNLAERFPVRAAVLNSLLDRKLSELDNSTVAEETELTEEMERSLRALGYLQ